MIPALEFLDGRRCDHASPILLSAEIGPTYTDLKTALALAEVAASAGFDVLKVQILDPEALIGRDTTVRWTDADGEGHEESMRAILRRRTLTAAEWSTLHSATRRAGLLFFATVDTPASLALARKIGADAFKIASGDIAYLDWIETVAQAGKPILLDTGHADLGEVGQAVDAARQGGAPGICVHHVPSGYPARVESMHLRVIPTLRQTFGDVAVIGFSDHHAGRDMDLLAVALGAANVEKTLTLDRRAWGPEHAMSVEPDEAKEFVQAIRRAEVALGSTRRIVLEAERVGKARARRSAFTTRQLLAGEYVTEDAVAWRRPAEGGIEPSAWLYLVGRQVRRRVDAGEQLRWEDLVGAPATPAA